MNQTEFGILDIATLVISGVCLTVGIVGIALPADVSATEKSKNVPTEVELIKVDLSPDETASPSPASRADTGKNAAPKHRQNPGKAKSFSPPPAPVALNAATPQKIITVAAPENVAITEPIAAPVAFTQNETAGENLAPATVNNTGKNFSEAAPETLTFGTGDGRQPAPEYPYNARRLNQTGNIRIRFRTDAAGRVTEAHAVAPCKFSALNESALYTIRNRWRFPPGAPRFCEIEICFKLK